MQRKILEFFIGAFSGVILLMTFAYMSVAIHNIGPVTVERTTEIGPVVMMTPPELIDRRPPQRAPPSPDHQRSGSLSTHPTPPATSKTLTLFPQIHRERVSHGGAIRARDQRAPTPTHQHGQGGLEHADTNLRHGAAA